MPSSMLRTIARRILVVSLPAFLAVSTPLEMRAQSGTAVQGRSGIRIAGPVVDSQRVSLAGQIRPEATAANDRGAVSQDFPMSGLILVLSRAPATQAAFDAFVRSQYDPGSPNYHHWLTPAEIGRRFGPAQADIDTIVGWLSSHGFTVTGVSLDRMSIRFSGTAGVVKAAFHTEIHSLSVGGESHIANMTAPEIPAALAPVIVGIKGLHNFFPRPLHHIGSRVQYDSTARRWTRISSESGSGTANSSAGLARLRPRSSAQPENYSPISNSTMVLEDVAPYDFAAIYNVLPVWNAQIDGSGEVISIIGTSDVDLADVRNFKSYFGLSAGTDPIIAAGPDGDPGICAGSTNVCNQGDQIENSLDVEWSGAVAPGAQIVLVADKYNSQTNPTNDPLYDGAQWAIENASTSGTAVFGTSILSMSYGQCELGMGVASNVAYNNLWQTAASAGIAVFVATGDSAAAGCEQGASSSYGSPYESQYGLAVNGLASSPWTTAVGGTDFSWCKPTYDSNGNLQGCTSSSAALYWNASNSSSTQASAKGYVAETPWNDSCMNPIWASFIESLAPLVSNSAPASAEASCNFIYNNWKSIDQNYGLMLAPYIDTAGGSGGASGCVSGDQANASSCSSSITSTGASEGNLTLVKDGWPKPVWQAGVTGIPDDGVRDLPDVSFFAGDGALDSATLICVASYSAPCTSATGTNTGALEIGGTSVATPEMAGVMALINEQTGYAQGNPNQALYAMAAAQTYSECSAENSTSSGCYFNDIDVGTISTPCDYQGKALEGGAVYGSNGWTLSKTSSGLASPDCSVSSPSDVVGALSGYGAATGYDQTTGLGSLNVSNVVNASAFWSSVPTGLANPTVSVSPASTAIYPDSPLNVDVAVSGTSGTPTGSIQISGGGYTSASATLSAGDYTFSIPGGSFSGTGNSYSVTLTANYAGDGTYNPASGTSSVTVNKRSSTVTVTPASQSINSNASLNVTVAVTGAGATPTGTMTLTSGSYSGTATLSGGSANFTIPADTFTTSGNYTLTANYAGDNIYTTGQNTASVNVTASPTGATVTVTAAPSVSPDQNLAVSITVAGSSGTPTGTVVLSGGGYTSSSQALSNGITTFLIPPGSFTGSGNSFSVIMTANYSGNTAYAQTSGSTSVTVAKRTPTVTVTPSTSSLSSTAALNVSVRVAGAGTNPTGTVSLATTGYSANSTLSAGMANFTIPANTFTSSGSFTLTASYTGDGDYISQQSSASVSVTAAVRPTVTVTPAASSINPDQSLSVGVSVAGANGTPTGNVVLSGGGYKSASQVLIGGNASFVIPAGGLTGTGDSFVATLTAAYSGDTGYTQASGTAAVTVQKRTSTITVTPASTSTKSNASLSVSVAVAGTGASPTGTIRLTTTGYSMSIAVSGGTANFVIPANTFANSGNYTLTASYSGDSVYAAGAGTSAIDVTEAAPLATVALAVAPSVNSDQSLAVGVTVAASNGGATPTGTVSISGGGYISPQQTLVNGSTTFTIPAGRFTGSGSSFAVTLAAVYNGNQTYPVTGGSASITVTKRTPSIAVTPSSSSIKSNTAFNVSVAVTGIAGTPTGTANLSTSGFTSAMALSGGVATFTVPADTYTASGNYPINVSYAGDGIYAAGQGSASVGVTFVSDVKPTVTVTPAAFSISPDQSLSVGVQVTGTSGTPTGTVVLSGGGYTSTAQTLGNGGASFIVPAGSFTGSGNSFPVILTATYNGSATYLAASGTNSITVQKRAPALTVTPASPSILSNAALQVSVALTGAGVTPTGAVTLSTTGYSSTVTSSGGLATFTIPAGTFTSSGNFRLTASYAGDHVYATGQNSAGVAVTLAAPTATVSVSAASVTSPDLSLAVNVAVTGTSAGTPTGSVVLSGGGYTSPTQALTNGTAAFMIPAESFIGTGNSYGVTLTAAYSGNSTYAQANGVLTITVRKRAATITVTPSSSSIGSSTALNVSVSAAGTGTTPTGAIHLSTTNFTGSANLSGGAAAFTIPAGTFTASGTYTLSASYDGDSIYASVTNSAPVAVTLVTVLNPTITVTPAATSINTGQSLSVNVTVGGANGAGTGMVTLASGAYSAQGQLANGSVAFVIPPDSLADGNDTLTATSTADANYTAGTGTARVSVTGSVYTISAGTVTPATIAPGASATTSITGLSQSTYYTGTVVASSCTIENVPTGVEYLPTCSTSGAITFTNGVASGSITAKVITTSSTVASLTHGSGSTWLGGGGVLLGMLAIFWLPAGWRKRRDSLLGVVLLVTVLGVAMSALSGCGGSPVGVSGGNAAGTPAGTYTFKVVATGSDPAATQASTTFTVTVN